MASFGLKALTLPIIGPSARAVKILYYGNVKSVLPALLLIAFCACSSSDKGPQVSPQTAESSVVDDSSSVASHGVERTEVKVPVESARLALDSVSAPDTPTSPSVVTEMPKSPTPPKEEPVPALRDQKLSPSKDGQEDRPADLGVRIHDGAEHMKLVSLAVGLAVKARNPVGVADRFTVIPPRFHCHSVVDSRVPESTIIHTWRRGDRVISRVELQVGKSPAWRTWSRQRIRAEWADVWSCTVSTLEGEILGAARFEVAPGVADDPARSEAENAR